MPAGRIPSDAAAWITTLRVQPACQCPAGTLDPGPPARDANAWASARRPELLRAGTIGPHKHRDWQGPGHTGIMALAGRLRRTA
jgi:hypothetical protein